MVSSRPRWLRWILIGLIAGAVLAAVTLALRPAPIPVETVQIRRGSLQLTVDGSAKTHMRDRAVVTAAAPGMLSGVSLRVGDPVRQGDSVVVLSPAISPPLDSRTRAEIEARLAAARAAAAETTRQVERARTAAELAEGDVERTRRLVETQAAPARNLEVAIAERDMRNTELRLAELAVRRARLETAAIAVLLTDPESTTAGESGTLAVVAPLSGVVLRVFMETGGSVTVGTPILEIGDPASLELRAELPTPDAARVAVGADVEIHGMGDTKVRSGRVLRIAPVAETRVTALGVEEQRVDVTVEMAEPPPVIGDGFSADVRIRVETFEDALLVPSGAVFRETDGFGVFVVQAGTARRTSVDVLGRNAQFAAVSGISTDQVVIVHPSDRIRDGVAVRPE